MSIVVRAKRGPVRADSRNVVRGDETRKRILAAARQRILADGFEALRLDDLARDAGVTKAAVIKSAGGKATILLTLGDEDRQTRIALIRAGLARRTALRRRLTDVVRGMFELDAARLNVVMPYIGYMWFWVGADHQRAQAMVDDTRAMLRELVVSASPVALSDDRLEILSHRILGGYALALREFCYGIADLERCVQLVVDYTLDAPPGPVRRGR